jgi:hypothetical protein
MTSGSANRSVRALYDRRMPSRRSIILGSMARSWTVCEGWAEGAGTKAWQDGDERAAVAATMAVAAAEKDTMVGRRFSVSKWMGGRQLAGGDCVEQCWS